MTPFQRALQALRPDAEYVNRDDTLANVTWGDGVTPPSQADVDRVIAAETKGAQIEAGFAAAVEAGVPYGGKVVQIRDQDRPNLTAIFSRAVAVTQEVADVTWPEDGFPWRMLDNSYLELTPAEFIAMAQKAADHYAALRFAYGQLKTALAVAATAEEVAAITVTYPEAPE